MSEPVIQANKNLLRNGDFSQALKEWTRNGVGTSTVTQESFDGENIRILNLSSEAGVSQEIAIPKTSGARARYTLSFLCQTLHVESGWLRIFKGEQELCAIELKPDPTRHLQDDLARLAAGQPLAFEPTPYELNLNVLVVAADTLRFEIISPKSEPDDYYSKVRITRLDVQLHLDPLTLQTVQLDEQTLSADSTVYLCLGATDSQAHKLIFMPPPDNAWDGTEASLTLDGNPQEAIIITPSEDIEQLLTEHWMLDCPVLGDEDRYSLTLNLLNRYASAPYKIAVSLGHHRLRFRQTLEAAYYPILEYEQRVQLGVRVASYYTGQVLAGLTVNWLVPGQGVTSASVTDDEGWAYYDFLPKEPGEIAIEATVESRYYSTGVTTEQFTVRVLATDPWRDLRAVVDDGETAWDAQGYPNRGSDYELMVRLPADSPLLETELSLYWTGDSHAQLEVEVFPELESPVPVDTLQVGWMLSSEDKLDGRFELSLVCSKLLRPSPGKPMSLARNRVKVGEVREANKSPVVDEHESVLLRLQVLHDTTGTENVPVSNALVDWQTPEGLETARSGADGWASLLYTPKAFGDLEVKACVKAHPEAVPVERVFKVHAIETSPWKDQVEILLDDEPVELNTLGVVCQPGKSYTLSVKPRTESPWINRNISLHWRQDLEPDIGLEPSDLAIPKPLATEGVQWTLAVTEQGLSSLFDLELRLEGLSVVRALPGRLLPADLNKEVSLLLDQVRIQMNDQALYPCLGAIHRFNVLPNGLSPLVGLHAALIWEQTEDLGATVCPPLDAPQVLTDGGAVWELNFSRSEQPGRFVLTLELPQLNFSAIAKPMVLHHNKVRVHVMREPAVDPVVNQVPAHLWVQIISHFTGRPVGDVPVKWWIETSGDTVRTDDEGWSGYAFAPEKADTYTVIALVENFFDDYEDTRSIDVTALAEDPWAGLKVSFDNQPEQPWAERTFFPRRKAQHQFKVTAAANSALLGKGLALGIAGGAGPAELDISFVGTSLGEPEPFSEDGLTYTFKVGDLKDGGFGLCFASERLASLSPVNAMSVGEGAPAMKIVSGERVMQTLLWEDAVSEQITVISVINGKPMAGVAVTWWSQDLGEVKTITNFYGVAKIRFVPSTPGGFELKATVGDERYSESIAIAFFLNEPRQILLLDSPDPSGHPGQEVSASVSVVSARTGEPLPDVEVEWEYPGIKISPTKTDSTGTADVRFRLPPVREGFLLATVKGGYAGWEIKTMRFTAMPNSDTWLQEFTLWLDDTEVDLVDGQLTLSRALTYDLELRVRKHSWLIGWVSVALEDFSGAEALGLTFDPELKALRPVDGEPIRWSVSTEVSGPVGVFTLQLTSPDLPNRLLSGQLSAFEIDKELEVKCNSISVALGETAYVCLGAYTSVNVRVKADSPLLGRWVTLMWEGDSAESLNVEVWPKNSQTLGAEWVSWTLDCKKSTQIGIFSLGWKDLRGTWATSLPLNMSLGHHLVSAERWTKVYDGPIYFYEEYGIRAISRFLHTPAPDVEVAVYRDYSTTPEYRYTNRVGEVVVIAKGQHISMTISNRFDGSIV